MNKRNKKIDRKEEKNKLIDCVNREKRVDTERKKIYTDYLFKAQAALSG